MSRRPNPRADLLRQAVAEEAARIMREQGVDDFLLAKRKAADRLGVTDASILPRNTEIEAARAAHQRLFAADRHEADLASLRRLLRGWRALHASLAIFLVLAIAALVLGRWAGAAWLDPVTLPRRIRVLPALPRVDTGKLERARLRALFEPAGDAPSETVRLGTILGQDVLRAIEAARQQLRLRR